MVYMYFLNTPKKSVFINLFSKSFLNGSMYAKRFLSCKCKQNPGALRKRYLIWLIVYVF